MYRYIIYNATQTKPNIRTGFSISILSLSIPAIINKVAKYKIPKIKYTSILLLNGIRVNFIEAANKTKTTPDIIYKKYMKK